ncbi:MAG: helix-turn-helix transcriptional regulator [Clostridia bacterium]|nr:helix-turn-helix transcriptional regulator [Clostridia bacterium]
MARNVYRIVIGDKIKNYREKNSISQNTFGKMIGVSPQAVCKWEMGTSSPDIIMLPLLADILECSTDDFFEKQ